MSAFKRIRVVYKGKNKKYKFPIEIFKIIKAYAFHDWDRSKYIGNYKMYKKMKKIHLSHDFINGEINHASLLLIMPGYSSSNLTHTQILMCKELEYPYELLGLKMSSKISNYLYLFKVIKSYILLYEVRIMFIFGFKEYLNICKMFNI